MNKIQILRNIKLLSNSHEFYKELNEQITEKNLNFLEDRNFNNIGEMAIFLEEDNQEFKVFGK